MSLSSLLVQRASPLRSMFQELLPMTPRFVRSVNDDLVTHPLNTPRPVDSGLSGTALDYRLRYYFAVTPAHQTVAGKGAGLMAKVLGDRSIAVTFARYFQALDREVHDLSPVGKLLDQQDELRLARHCVVLAYLEQFRRSGRSILFDFATGNGIPDDLVRLPPRPVVADVAAVSGSFFEHQYALLANRGVDLNPTFAGSQAIGGADADILVGDCLVDFKSTMTSRPIVGRDVYQILSYVCLDYEDEYRIRRVGFSVLRRDALREWDLAGLLDELSAGGTTISLLRSRMRELVTSLPPRRA